EPDERDGAQEDRCASEQAAQAAGGRGRVMHVGNKGQIVCRPRLAAEGSSLTFDQSGMQRQIRLAEAAEDDLLEARKAQQRLAYAAVGDLGGGRRRVTVNTGADRREGD